MFRPLSTALSLVALAGAASAQTPLGTFSSNLDGTVFSGAGIGLSAFGPGEDEVVTGARLEVEFDFDGATPASDLMAVFQLPVDGGVSTWIVTGADLGFPSSGGQFSGSIETDLLDGLVFNNSPFPFVPLEINVMATSGPLFGTANQLELTLELGPRITADVPTISVATGGQQNYDVAAGPIAAGDTYLVLGGISGTSPGVQVGGVDVPINVDFYTRLLLQNPNVFIQGSLGVLDGFGQATAQLAVPPFPLDFVGLEVNHLALVFDGSLNLLSASDPVSLTYLP